MASPQVETINRRIHQRYPVEAQLEYNAVLGNGALISGAARIVDLSTGGLLLESSSYLPIGLTIQLSIAWPQRANSAIGLRLHAIGLTVRNEGNFTAVRIQEHEIRPTRKAVQEQPQNVQLAKSGWDMPHNPLDCR